MGATDSRETAESLRPTRVRLDEQLYRWLDVIADEHRVILDPIATGDPDGASDVAARHCDASAELMAGYRDSPVAL